MNPCDFVPGVVPPGPPTPAALLFLARGLDLVLTRPPGADDYRVPSLAQCMPFADGLHYLGMMGAVDCYTAPLAEDARLPPELELLPARALYGQVDLTLFGVAGRAIAIAEWDRTHRFCGKCGARTALVPNERSRKCPSCRTPYYPRVPPAVIVLVERGREVLLARGANFPRPWFSTLAGFVEPGESLEECVAREVFEEVGVQLRDLRYFASQPWPFGRSLMIGFTARFAGGELKPDASEISEARWFTPDAMPELPPKLSIARALIDDWLERQKA